jgi:soluble lytic murein transglycosylase-like protein
MLSSTWRRLGFTIVVLALPAQPALARSHSGAAHRWHHHYAHRASSHRYRFAHRYARRQHYARVARQDGWSFEWQPQGFWNYSPDAAPTAAFSGGYPDRYSGAAVQEGRRRGSGGASAYSGMVEQQASANGVPASLVHRVIMRESGYNPRAVHSGNYGMMQIKLGTARAMGYGGSAEGLLNPATNMTYAVRYLAGAYRVAGGNADRAVALYARGYNAGRESFGYERVAYRVRRHYRHHPV